MALAFRIRLVALGRGARHDDGQISHLVRQIHAAGKLLQSPGVKVYRYRFMLGRSNTSWQQVNVGCVGRVIPIATSARMISKEAWTCESDQRTVTEGQHLSVYVESFSTLKDGSQAQSGSKHGYQGMLSRQGVTKGCARARQEKASGKVMYSGECTGKPS